MSAPARPNRVPMLVWQFLLAAAVLAAWQWGAGAGWLDKFFFSRPGDIGARVWKLFATGSVWGNLGPRSWRRRCHF